MLPLGRHDLTMSLPVRLPRYAPYLACLLRKTRVADVNGAIDCHRQVVGWLNSSE